MVELGFGSSVSSLAAAARRSGHILQPAVCVCVCVGCWPPAAPVALLVLLVSQKLGLEAT